MIAFVDVRTLQQEVDQLADFCRFLLVTEGPRSAAYRTFSKALRAKMRRLGKVGK